jgi:hypothetical protein
LKQSVLLLIITLVTHLRLPFFLAFFLSFPGNFNSDFSILTVYRSCLVHIMCKFNEKILGKKGAAYSYLPPLFTRVGRETR